MEYFVLDIILAVIMFILIVYNMIMIGLMSTQTAKVDISKNAIDDKRTAIETKYKIV